MGGLKPAPRLWTRCLTAGWFLLSALTVPGFGVAEPSKADLARAQIALVRANEDLIRALSAMGAISKLIRLRYLKILKDASPQERAQLDAVWIAEYKPIDAENTAALRGLLQGRDWFKRSEVGDQAAASAFDVVQHSDDLALQQSVLEKMKPLLGTDELEGQFYALIYDRIALQIGKPQRYGTQHAECQNGKYAMPANIEDRAHLEERRSQLGMAPMAAYLADMDAMYGRCDPTP